MEILNESQNLKFSSLGDVLSQRIVTLMKSADDRNTLIFCHNLERLRERSDPIVFPFIKIIPDSELENENLTVLKSHLLPPLADLPPLLSTLGEGPVMIFTSVVAVGVAGGVVLGEGGLREAVDVVAVVVAEVEEAVGVLVERGLVVVALA